MDKKEAIQLAERILEGREPDQDTLARIAHTPDHEVFDLMAGASTLRNAFFGNRVQLCTICNAKSGKCSEDCAFCSQSAFAKAQIPVYPLDPDIIKQGAQHAKNGAVARFSVVTSGKRLPKNEVKIVGETLAACGADGINYCASLGTLGPQDLKTLKEAGVTRYHHNLETAKSHYPHICTTHSFDERVGTVKAAKDIGLSVCSGGLFGMGESDLQVLELALTLKTLDVDAVPINFLTPIQGTKMEGAGYLTPLRCLKIIALFRFVLPQKEIIICGGREANLKELHPLVFFAGASGIMTGNYLTTEGRTMEKDLEMLEHLGLEPIQPGLKESLPA